MQPHQKLFLIKDWEGRIATLSADGDERQHLGPVAVHWVEGAERFTEWLRGGCPPHPELRGFVEEGLTIFDRETGYEQLSYEHDAMAAAVEELS
jgi:hypothetical protein